MLEKQKLLNVIWGVALTLFFSVQVSISAEYYVGEGQAYTRITNAVNNANDGDTIIVKEGIYKNESIDIEKSFLTIRSEKNYTATTIKDSTITIVGDKNIFSGFSVKNYRGTGIKIKGSGNTISKNKLFYIYSGDGISISGNRNNIHNNISTGRDIGIIINGDKNIIFKNTVEKNNTGIAIERGIQNTISQNICKSNYDFGVYVDGSHHIINDNKCFSNDDGSILVKGNNHTISGNLFSTNHQSLGSSSTCGIQLNGASHNFIFNNKILKNSYGIQAKTSYGYNSKKSKNNYVFLNYFDDNTRSIGSLSNNFLHVPHDISYEYNDMLFNGLLGNYYNDHHGTGIEESGVIDSRYKTLSTNVFDNFPLTKTPENYKINMYQMDSNNNLTSEIAGNETIVLEKNQKYMWLMSEKSSKKMTINNIFNIRMTFFESIKYKDSLTIEIGYMSNKQSAFIPVGAYATVVGDKRTKIFHLKTNEKEITIPSNTYLSVRIINNSTNTYSLLTGGAKCYIAIPNRINLAPVITSIFPLSASEQKNITITGYYFGHEQNDGYVTYGNKRVVKYLEWTDERIICEIIPYADDKMIDIVVTSPKTVKSMPNNFYMFNEHIKVSNDGQISKIQDAVFCAEKGQTIIVSPGKYTEHIYIGKPVIIKSQSDNHQVSIISKNEYESVIDIDSENVTIEGMTLYNQYNNNIPIIDVFYNANNSKILNNVIISRYSTKGIEIYESSNCKIINNQCIESRIQIEHSANNIIKNNHCIGDGICLKYSYKNDIIKNVCRDYKYGIGIEIKDSGFNNIVFNTLFDNRTGIRVEEKDSWYLLQMNYISNNNIYNNEHGMILEIHFDRDSEDENIPNNIAYLITNNTIKNCHYSGISFEDCIISTIIAGNTFHSNENYGIIIENEQKDFEMINTIEDTYIYYNNFIDNRIGQVKTHGSHNLIWNSPTLLHYRYDNDESGIYDDHIVSQQYVGNFYNDYESEDRNYDGIYDMPYTRTEGKTVDNYPLVMKTDFYKSQILFLNNDGIMYWRNQPILSKPTTIEAHNHKTWVSDRKFKEESSIDEGKWTGQLIFNYEVEDEYYYDDDFQPFEFKIEIGTSSDGIELTNIILKTDVIKLKEYQSFYTFEIDTQSFYVHQDEYLALRIHNNSDRNMGIMTGGEWSYLSTPKGCHSLSKKDIYVNQDGNENELNSIQDAINLASDNDTIIVRKGTYIENIIINKSLNILSEEGPENTIIKAANSKIPILHIQSNNTTINGFTLFGATEHSGIFIDQGTKNCLIEGNNCGIENNKSNKYGIQILESDNHTINNNVCKFNSEAGIYLNKETQHANIISNNCQQNKYGIYLFRCQHNKLNNNICSYNDGGILVNNWSIDNSFKNNLCSNNGLHIQDEFDLNKNDILSGFGVKVKESNWNDFKQNKCSDNKHGIIIQKSSANGLYFNDLNKNQYTGIYFNNEARTMTSYQNNITNNKHGVYIKNSQHNNLIKNSIIENEDGITFLNAHHNTLYKNIIKKNINGLSTNKSKNNFIYLNTFSLNSQKSIYSLNSLNFYRSPSRYYYDYNNTTYSSYLGNFYSDFINNSQDDDGVSNTSYPIQNDNEDQHPLNQPDDYYEPKACWLHFCFMFYNDPSQKVNDSVLHTTNESITDSDFYSQNNAINFHGKHKWFGNISFSEPPKKDESFTVEIGYINSEKIFTPAGMQTKFYGNNTKKHFMLEFDPVKFSIPKDNRLSLKIIRQNIENNNVMLVGGVFSYLSFGDNATAFLPNRPELEIINLDVPSQAKPGEKIDIKWTVKNTGTKPTNEDWEDCIYLSKNLHDNNNNKLFCLKNPKALQADESYERIQEIELPSWYQGYHWIIAETDVNDHLLEIDDYNNQRVSEPLLISLTTCPDLIPIEDVKSSTQILNSGQDAHIQWQIKNIGNESTNTIHWYDQLLISETKDLKSSIPVKKLYKNQMALGPDEIYQQSVYARIPDGLQGEYFLIVKTDTQNQMKECNEQNNTLISKEPVSIVYNEPPLISIQDLNVIPSQIWQGSEVTVQWRLSNNGKIPTGEFKLNHALFLSSDNILGDNNDILLKNTGDIFAGHLNPDQTSDIIKTEVTIPFNIGGKYYIFVWPDPAEKNNFNTSYAFIPIEIIISVTPNLIINKIQHPDIGLSGHNIKLSWNVENVSGEETYIVSWNDVIFLSKDKTLNENKDDILLKNIRHYGFLGENESYTITTNVSIPTDIIGEYYFIVKTDYNNELFEGGFENDNLRVSDRIINIKDIKTDLIVEDVTVKHQDKDFVEILSGETISVQWFDKNSAPGDIPKSKWIDNIYLSTGNTLSNTAIVLDSLLTKNSLDSGKKVLLEKHNVMIPIHTTGDNMTIFVCADDDNQIYESDDNNNCNKSSSFSIAWNKPDLKVNNINVNKEKLDQIDISWSVINVGGPTMESQFWYDGIYFSEDRWLDSNDTLIAKYSQNKQLGYNMSYEVQKNIDITDDISGSFFIIVKADVIEDSQIIEIDETNNSISSNKKFHFGKECDYDLIGVKKDNNLNAFSGQYISLDWDVNIIGDKLQTDFYDMVYLSKDAYLDDEDLYLDSVIYVNNSDDVNSSLGVLVDKQNSPEANQNKMFKIPQNLEGLYNLLVLIDGYNSVCEKNENNNTIYFPINIEFPSAGDLVVEEIILSEKEKFSGKQIDIQWRVINNNDINTEGSWHDAVYLSTDSIWDINDLKLGVVKYNGGNRNEFPYLSQLSVRLPGVIPGKYKIIVRTDIYNEVQEINDGENNNTYVSTEELSIDCNRIILGHESTSHNIHMYQPHYFKIENLNDNNDILITLNANHLYDYFIELYVSYGEFPDHVKYDHSALLYKDSNELFIPKAQKGTYFVLLRVVHSSNITYQIEARSVSFEIRDVKPDIIGTNGEFTLEVIGSRLTPETTFDLYFNDEKYVSSKKLYYQDSGKVYVTFGSIDQPGSFNLVAINENSQKAIKENAISVDIGKSPRNYAKLTGPSPVRFNRFYSYQLNYGNSGDSDTRPKLYIIENKNKTPFGLYPETLMDRKKLIVLGISLNGPPEILRPQGNFNIPLYYNSSTEKIHFSLKVIDENSTEYIDWDNNFSTKSSIFIENWKKRYGTTWGEYLKELIKTAKYLDTIGKRTYDTEKLHDYMYHTTLGIGKSMISGQVVDYEKNLPLSNAKIIISSNNPNGIIRETETDNKGNFTFTNVISDLYNFTVYGYKVKKPLELYINDTEDITDVAVQVSPYTINFNSEPDPDKPIIKYKYPKLLNVEGTPHLVVLKDSYFYHTTYVNDKWTELNPIPEAFGKSPIFIYSGKTKEPKLFLFWIKADYHNNNDTLTDNKRNDSEYYSVHNILYSVAKKNSKNNWEWSEPQIYHKANKNIGIDNINLIYKKDDDLLMTWQMSDRNNIQDDTDLYFDTKELEVDNLKLPVKQSKKTKENVKNEYLDVFPQNETIPFFSNGDMFIDSINSENSCPKNWGYEQQLDFTLIDIEADIPNKVPFIGGLNSQLIVKGHNSLNIGIPDASISGFEVGDFCLFKQVGGQISLGFNVNYKLDKERCEYVFNNLSLYEIKTALYVKFPLFVYEMGVFSCNVNIEFKGQGVGTLSMTRNYDILGSFRDVISLGIIGEAELGKYLMSVGTRLSGTGYFTTIFDAEGYRPDKIFIEGAFEWHIGYFAGKKSIVYPNDQNFLSSNDILSNNNPQNIIIAIKPGSKNVYFSRSIIKDVEKDIIDDGEPVMVEHLGNIYLFWTRESSDPKKSIGNMIYYSIYNNSQWSKPVSLKETQGFNTEIALSKDQNGNLIIVWAHSDSSNYNINSDIKDVWPAVQNSDIYYMKMQKDKTWSQPSVIAKQKGSAHDINTHQSNDEKLWVTWSELESGIDTLYVTSWNGINWSKPISLTKGINQGKVSIVTIDGITKMIWKQQPDPQTTIYDSSKSTLLYTSNYLNGNWTTPVLLDFDQHKQISKPSSSLDISDYYNPFAYFIKLRDKFHSPPSSCCNSDDDQDEGCGGYYGEESEDSYYNQSKCCCSAGCKCDGEEEDSGGDDDDDGDDSGNSGGSNGDDSGGSDDSGAQNPYRPDNLRPIDPNEKQSSSGSEKEKFIRKDKYIRYTVYFENKPDATAPAQQVTITDKLSGNLDLLSFKLVSIVFGDTVIIIPDQKPYFMKNIKINENMIININAGLDIQSGIAKWLITALDPKTGEMSDNPLDGFLPPNDPEKHNGEGYVEFLIKPKKDLDNLTEIVNQATIIFDKNEPIITNQIFNTIDTEIPSSTINPLPAEITPTTFTVCWSADEKKSGSKVINFDIYVSDNKQPYELWKSNITDLCALFVAKPGHTYRFFSIVRDQAGNVEESPEIEDAIITVINLEPPSPEMQKIPLHKGWNLMSFNINKCFFVDQKPEVPMIDSIEYEKVDHISDVLKSIDGQYSYICGYDKTGIKTYNLSPFSDLKYLAAGYGYWIKINNNASFDDNNLIYFEVSGNKVPKGTAIQLHQGWNLVGYLGNTVQYTHSVPDVHFPENTVMINIGSNKIAEVFNSISGKYSFVRGFDETGMKSFNLTPFTDFKYVGPGYGYWIKIDDENGAALLW